MSDIKGSVKKGLTPIVVMLAVLIVSAMTAAASIQTALRNGVLGAAGIVELYLFLYMLDQV